MGRMARVDRQLADLRGGGYEVRRGPNERDDWFVGCAAQRSATRQPANPPSERSSHQTAETAHGAASSGFNLAALYDVSAVVHLVACAGRGLAQVRTRNEYSYYAALELTF